MTIQQNERNERFPPSALAELEQELSRTQFNGESVAAATSSFLNPYRTFRGRRSLSRLLAENGLLALKLVLGPVISIVNRSARARLYASASGLVGQILVNSMSEKTHYQKMLSALVSQFRSDEVVGIGLQSEVGQSIFLRDRYFQKRDIGTVCRVSDQVAIAKAARSWVAVLIRFRKRFGLSSYFVVRALACLLQASLGMLAYQEFLRYLRPKCVVSDFDRYSGNLPLVAAANSLGMLSITLQHGTINRTGWETLPSQYFLGWGERSKSRLVEWHGIESERVLVCGNMMIVDQMQAGQPSKASIRAAADECMVVGFAPQPYPMEIRKSWFLEFVEAVTPLSLRVLIKPHPAEDVSLYQSYTESAGKLELLNRNTPVFEFFERCDIVVAMGSSSVAMEAISAGKPVVLLVVEDVATSAAKEWSAADAVLLARTSKELREILTALQSDSAYYATRAAAGKKYLGREYASIGREAARQTHSAITSLIQAYGK